MRVSPPAYEVQHSQEQDREGCWPWSWHRAQLSMEMTIGCHLCPETWGSPFPSMYSGGRRGSEFPCINTRNATTLHIWMLLSTFCQTIKLRQAKAMHCPWKEIFKNVFIFNPQQRIFSPSISRRFSRRWTGERKRGGDRKEGRRRGRGERQTETDRQTHPLLSSHTCPNQEPAA